MENGDRLIAACISVLSRLKFHPMRFYIADPLCIYLLCETCGSSKLKRTIETAISCLVLALGRGYAGIAVG